MPRSRATVQPPSLPRIVTTVPTAAQQMQKDVQPNLLRAPRRTRRRPGDVPYPVQYSNNMADFDIWEHMFLVSCHRGLTTHHFAKPPQVVLDLGCGSGHWALEAAKQWESSTIVGFDIANVQPNLHELEHHRHLASRVKWAHGNMLDGLPFVSSQFDYVRAAYIGLGVPEDEWQFLLEEIVRVMKPGGVLELIEEDLIFPCTTQPPEPPSSPGLDLSFRNFGASSSSTLVNEPISPPPQEHLSKPPVSPLKSLYRGLTRKSTSKLRLNSTQAQRESSFGSQYHLDSPACSKDPATMETKHPQDHSRLEAAWDLMLSNRFICPTILSVLPFYMSSFLTEVKTHPPYRVYLPPNSNAPLRLRSRHSAESFRPSSKGGRGVDTPYDFNLPPPAVPKVDAAAAMLMHATRNNNNLGGGSSSSSVQRWTALHLSRTVNTITACKTPIWEEYQKLYRDEYIQRYSHTEYSLRQLFDRDWNSWQNDMLDRLSLREKIGAGLSWQETAGAKPDHRKWRSEFEPSLGSAPPPKLLYDPSDLCRSLRVFVAKKAQ